MLEITYSQSWISRHVLETAIRDCRVPRARAKAWGHDLRGVPRSSLASGRENPKGPTYPKLGWVFRVSNLGIAVVLVGRCLLLRYLDLCWNLQAELRDSF